jgi:hypothetical protein
VTEPTTPAAGWYPDPAGGEGLRWWTGVTWTDDVRPSPWASATPTAAAPADPVVTSAPPTATPAWVLEPDGAPGLVVAAGDATGLESRSRTGRGMWIVVGAIVVVIALVAGTVAALGSLSSRSKLDMTAVEEDIAHRVAQRTGQVATVDCPDSVDIESGATFTCSVTTEDGTALDVQVHQDDDQGNLTVSGLPQ